MNQEDLIQYFSHTLRSDPSMSEAMAAIKSLIEFIKLNSATTLTQLRQDLMEAIQTLKSSDNSTLVTSIYSACELFLRFITLTESIDQTDFRACKLALVDRGNLFLQKTALSRQKIANLAQPFITDGAIILLHSRSRVVLEVLREAAKCRKRFTVYVTETNPEHVGQKLLKELEELDIPTVVILDSAIGYIMEKVDMVLVGAEGVVESGGIINRIGTFTTAICAKEMNKPFYVVAESFKFARLYPLNQQDVPNQFKYKASILDSNAELVREHPMVDYTPPSYITLLFTDLGILTPSAVSDVLIKLYL